MSVLHAQSENMALRFHRPLSFWKTAFMPLEMYPNLINMPNETDKKMYGCVAERDIAKGKVLVYAQGFWWPRCCPRPVAHRMCGENLFDEEWRCPIFGVASSAKGAKNMLYMINASDPLSLVNDYRGLADGPNASLVNSSFHCCSYL